MMNGFITLSDGTGIAYSEIRKDGTVKVYFEKPVHSGFQNATCCLPDYRWEDINGFSEDDIQELQSILQDNEHLILEYAQRDGSETAKLTNPSISAVDSVTGILKGKVAEALSGSTLREERETKIRELNGIKN